MKLLGQMVCKTLSRCITERGGWTSDDANSIEREYNSAIMDDTRTTVVVQRFLNELAGVKGDSPAEPIVRALLASAVDRLHLICTTLLFRSYSRLTRPPLNLQADELLSSVVERLLKAMRGV